ncbi:MAG: TolC family protein [Deltaproteobacteria bacterium]|nr:TolC family protein [Deltaproteobacteria bacterium]
MYNIVKLLSIIMCISFFLQFHPAHAQSVNKPRDLSIETAISKAMATNPDLVSSRAEIDKGRARIRQAGLYPNPKLSFELEGFGGSRDYSGTKIAEQTLAIEQEILLGNKTGKQINLAKKELNLTRWDIASLESDIRKEVKLSFVDVLSVQGALALQQNLMEVSGQVYNTVKQKAEAGKVSPIEVIKADIDLKKDRLELNMLKRSHYKTRKQLASFWGRIEPDFRKVSGNIDLLPPLVTEEVLRDALWNNPDLKRFKTEKRLMEAKFSVESAKRIPDLELSGGIRQIPETDDYAFVAGITVPLNIFDRNQGNIEKAGISLKQVMTRQSARFNLLRRELNAVYQEARIALNQINTLKDDIIPSTEKVFRSKQEGYRSGKFNYLEVLDAKRVLFESKKQYIEYITLYRQSIIKIERLTGESLDKDSL